MAISRDQAVAIAAANAPAGGYTDAQIQEWADWAVTNPDVIYSPNPAQQMANAMSVAQSAAGETPSYDVTPIDIGGGYQSAGYDFGTYEASVPATGGLTYGQAKSIIEEFAPREGYTPEQIDTWAKWAVSNPDVLYSSDPRTQIINSLVTEQTRAGETPTGTIKEIVPKTTTAAGGTTTPLTGLVPSSATADPARVTQLYYELLGRAPDQEGLAFWTSQPAYNLESSFYKAAVPEIQREQAKQLAKIPVSTNIPQPLIGKTPPGAQPVSVTLPGQFVSTDGGAPQPLSVDISKMAPEQQSLTNFIVGKMPQPTTTPPATFSPENVSAQLELERLKAMNASRTTDQAPVAGFAQGGMVSNDVNRLLQNQRQAMQRDSQSRQMLSTLGAPPVKKFSDGGPAGSSSDDMFVGMRPEDFPETSDVDKKAGELLRALSEGTRGFVGAEPIEPGSEAYRTGQALANMPAIGVAAGTIKGAGKAKDALKALTKKDIKLIASELETSRGQLAELVKKYPQLRDASVADIEALTKGEPFTAFRGISLLPGRELQKESTPSMTVDPSVALGMLKDAPVIMTKEGFITATPVLRQYPGIKASETQVYVPSLIEQITERQPGALEMKIPTRSGEKMTVADVFKEVKGEKELLADISKKEPRDILFNRYQGGIGDRYLMEVARRVLAGKWEGGEALLKEIGGYQTDPKGLVQEFDSFAELVKESALKKAKGGEVTNDEFIKSLGDRSRKDLATIKEAIAEIGKNKDLYADLEKKGYTPTDIEDPVKNAAYGLFLTSKTSDDPQRFLSTLSPFYDSKIEFDYTTDRSTLGEVQPYSTEARVYTTGDRGVALHELVHTLQMRRAKDIAEGEKEINKPMSRTVGDKVFQRAADLAKKGEITFPATNWKQDKGELMANVYDMSRKYEEAGKDFTKSIEFKKLFPDEESRLYYYTQTLPDTSVVYPAGSSFEPIETRDKSKSYARQLLGFAAGGEITKFIKDNR